MLSKYLPLLLLISFFNHLKAQSITDFYLIDTTINKNKDLFIFAFCKADCTSCNISISDVLNSIKKNNTIPNENIIAIVSKIRVKELPFYQKKFNELPIIPKLYLNNNLYDYICSLLNYNDNFAGGILITNPKLEILLNCNIKDNGLVEKFNNYHKKKILK